MPSHHLLSKEGVRGVLPKFLLKHDSKVVFGSKEGDGESEAGSREKKKGGRPRRKLRSSGERAHYQLAKKTCQAERNKALGIGATKGTLQFLFACHHFERNQDAEKRLETRNVNFTKATS